MIKQPSLTEKINLKGLTRTELESFVVEWGEPKYRAQQVMSWLYHKRVTGVEAMTNLSKGFRSKLAAEAYISNARVIARTISDDDLATKYLFELTDGVQVESVLMSERNRVTVCVSSQVGCAMGCDFCATGKMGFFRNLTAAEILDGLIAIERELDEKKAVTNIVFMGMGEPLANLDEVSDAIHRLTNTQWGLGFSPRRITISTAGLATRLHETAGLGVNLAISLNATTNEQRGRLMPRVNQLHPLPELLNACRTYPLSRGRRLTFEYVLLAGENDSATDAKRLAKLLKGIRCKINLIPFNEFPGNPFRRPDEAVVIQFQSLLRQSHFDVFIRKSRGLDILGACGQLGDLPL